MKRGKIGILFLALIFSITTISAIDLEISPSYSSEGSVLVITGLRYEPYPVGPGEQFDLWVKIENRGAQEFANATCIIKPDYPFSLYQGESVKSYGKLRGGDVTVFQFKLAIDQKSVQGSNELQVWCTKDPSSNAWTIQKIPILVQTRYPTLNIKGVKTEPSLISPGEDAVLLLSLENLADSAMKDILVRLDLSSVSIAPSGEIAEKKLRMLESSGIADLIFSIKALPDAEGGIYKIPFTLSYTNNLGDFYNQTGIIGIQVASKPELIFSADSTTISKSDRIGEVSIKITNAGLTDLKFVRVEILPSKNFKLLSNDVFYIGDIDSDDFGTASFKLSVKTSKNFEIPLNILFRDAINNEYAQNVSVTFNMLSAKEMGQKSSTGILITILISIVVLLAIFVKRFRDRIKGLVQTILAKIKR